MKAEGVDHPPPRLEQQLRVGTAPLSAGSPEDPDHSTSHRPRAWMGRKRSPRCDLDSACVSSGHLEQLP